MTKATQENQGSHRDRRERLTRTVYLFGSTKHGNYGHMTFAPGGRVGTRLMPDEYRYALDNHDNLSFRNAQRVETSSLAPLEADNSFGPVSGHPHYLHPVLELAPPPEGGKRRPVFVNTTPKAGTYLCARALENIGFRNIGLHVMDNFCHDNRGIPEDEIHYDPDTRHLSCPARAIAALMRKGEFVVGHLSELDEMQAVHRSGVRMLNIIREPRSMLLSMFAFKKAKVKPTAEDKLWQSMQGLEAFKAFLIGLPLDHILRQTWLIADNFRYLKYEDLRQGKIGLWAAGASLGRRLPGGVKAALGQPTSTYMPRETNPEVEAYLDDVWVRQFLEDKGALDLSRRLWPELNRP